MEYELLKYSKVAKNSTQRKERIPQGILSFISPSGREGLERPLRKLSGGQFLGRGRVLHIPDAPGTGVDGI